MSGRRVFHVALKRFWLYNRDRTVCDFLKIKLQRDNTAHSGGHIMLLSRSKRSFQIAVGVAGLALFAMTPPALAQAANYPNKPVSFVVPYAPGGTTDRMARFLGKELDQRLNGTFVIENRPGAASSIGAAHLAKAAPDGQTIMLGTSTTMAINPSIYKKLAYDPLKDLQPVALVAGIPFLLVVNPDVPAKTVKELIALAKSKPGSLSYASNGHGGAGHLYMELFKTMTGTEMTHVPYKGLAPGLQDTVAGHTQVMFGDFSTAYPLVKAGKLRALGVSTKQRVAADPSIAPIAELGVPGYDASSWQMVIAPAGIPKDILDKLNAELKAIIASKKTQDDFNNQGIIPLVSPSPEELQAFVKAELTRWAEVVNKAGAAGKK